MKHRSTTFLLAIALMICSFAQSCDSSDDVIWDSAPVCASIDIQDASGKTLLDPKAADNIIGELMTLEDENGNVYTLEWDKNIIQSRYYFAVFQGLTFRYSDDLGIPGRVYLGELPGDEQFSHQYKLTFRGITHEIKITNKPKNHGQNATFYLDGKKMEDGQLVIEAPKVDDSLIDLAPINVFIDLREDGRSLLDPLSTPNAAGAYILVEYEGNDYKLDWRNYRRIYSRLYLPNFYGVILTCEKIIFNEKTDQYEEPWLLKIGEFPGNPGTESIFKFSFWSQTHEIKIVNTGDTKHRTTEYYLDGEKQDSSGIIDIKVD